MKTLVLIAILAVAGFAQSKNANDYKVAFYYRNIPHFVDTSSIQFLSNNRVVFWSMFRFDTQTIALTSLEVNCAHKQARIRAMLFEMNNDLRGIKIKTGWFARTDPIASRYVTYACSYNILLY